MAVGERIRMLRQRHKAHGLENPARAGNAKLRLPLIQASATLPSSSSSFRKPHEPVPALWTTSHALQIRTTPSNPPTTIPVRYGHGRYSLSLGKPHEPVPLSSSLHLALF